jgi:pantoate--beta-alanine ligase
MNPEPTTIRTVADLRRAVAAGRGRSGRTVGLVPTMGALHDGHLALIRRARAESDVVVMSLFVNPRQFGPAEDLDRYPRGEARDAELARAAGVDILFAPDPAEVYPDGFATTVSVAGLSARLCGARRGAEHFDAVATIVVKLLNMVGPDVAYFGQKDAQQAAVIRRVVRDLDIPVRIAVCPTVREADGLAMSSRNAYLDAGERARAVGLSRALDAAVAAAAGGEHDPRELGRVARQRLATYGIDPEYVELVSPETLEPAADLDRPVLVAVAARVGRTRLIDNVIVDPTSVDGVSLGPASVDGVTIDPASVDGVTPNPQEARQAG